MHAFLQRAFRMDASTDGACLEILDFSTVQYNDTIKADGLYFSTCRLG